MALPQQGIDTQNITWQVLLASEPRKIDDAVRDARETVNRLSEKGASAAEIATSVVAILQTVESSSVSIHDLFTDVVAQTNTNVEKARILEAKEQAFARVALQQAASQLSIEEAFTVQHAYNTYGSAVIDAVAQAAGISSAEAALRGARRNDEDRAILGEVKHETVAQQAAFQDRHVEQIIAQVAQSDDPQIQAAVANIQKQADKVAKGEASIVLSQDTEFDVADLLHAKFGGNPTISQFVKDPRLGAGVVLLEILQQLDKQGIFVPDVYIGGGMEPAQALQALANRDPDQFAMATYSASHLGSAGVYDKKEVETVAKYVWTNIDVNLDQGASLINFDALAQSLSAQAEGRQPSYTKATRSSEYDASQSLVGTALEINNEWRTTIADNVAGKGAARAQ